MGVAQFLRQGVRGVQVGDRGGDGYKDAALRVSETTKNNVYPKPDYQALVDGGMEPVVAHIVKQAYDSLATGPNVGNRAPTDQDLKNYIEGIARFMNGVTAWESPPAKRS